MSLRYTALFVPQGLPIITINFTVSDIAVGSPLFSFNQVATVNAATALISVGGQAFTVEETKFIFYGFLLEI